MADHARGITETPTSAPSGRRALTEQPSTEVAAALGRYRCGASVASVAAALDLNFDAIARLVIAAGIRRDVVPGRPPRAEPPESLADADWVRSQLEAGRTISDIADHLGVDADVAGAAVTGHGFTVASTLDVARDAESERTELVERFRIGVEDAQAAEVTFGRALALQAFAVSELARSGLTVPAIADRIGVHDTVVLELLTISAEDGHVDVAFEAGSLPLRRATSSCDRTP
jgi:hypothetical protein